MLDHKEILAKHDKSYRANQTTRDQASDDLIFYWVTQWDDQLLSSSQLQYRGQFDIVRKAGRQILSAMKQNVVQPDFKPKNESRTDDAELMDGMYRADDRKLQSQEAYDYAAQEQVACGFGAWELYTEYETNEVGDDRQKICREFIAEANNTVFWDANAKRLDKSDANYVTVLKAYTVEGYQDLVEELTGTRPEKPNAGSFGQPNESYTFPWIEEQDKIYVGCFYHREKVKDKVISLADPFGSEIYVHESKVNQIMDELVDAGYNVTGEKAITRWQVTKYIVSGEDIIKSYEIAGQNIPVVPVYGERTIVEGEEYYEGIVRLAKDPQRLRNFQMSYLADIASQSPRNKPIFFAEQIQGFESMYEQAGADNNLPYYLLNRKTEGGEDLSQIPMQQMPDQNIPPALAAVLQMSREAVEDVANPALPQNLGDPEMSGKAVRALQSAFDQQSYQYQHNFKFAKRRDAEIYAGMASEIIDTPRSVTIETPDGQSKKVQIMETVIDRQTGEVVTINDVSNLEFDVYAEIGQSYQTQKDQTREDLIQIASALDPNDPLRKLATMKAIELMDGIALDDMRKHIHKELLISGMKEPETEEDLAVLKKAAEAKQKPDPAMLLAEAENKKGEADLMQQKRGFMKDKADIILNRTETQIDAFNAQTQRQKVMMEAEEKNISIQNKSIEAEGKHLDNQRKEFELEEMGFERDLQELDTEELAAMIGG